MTVYIFVKKHLRDCSRSFCLYTLRLKKCLALRHYRDHFWSSYRETWDYCIRGVLARESPLILRESPEISIWDIIEISTEAHVRSHWDFVFKCRDKHPRSQTLQQGSPLNHTVSGRNNCNIKEISFHCNEILAHGPPQAEFIPFSVGPYVHPQFLHASFKSIAKL